MEVQTIIIGAGPAGLAVAACLTRKGLPYLMLEKTDLIAPAWQRHYDRLHLHTDKGHSHLPFVKFKSGISRYPTRQEFVDYCQEYARHFKILPQFNETVSSVKQSEHGWDVVTETQQYSAKNIVMATGFSCKPKAVNWPGTDDFQGEIIHSSEYKNGARFAGKKVIVVGFGNSAGEIAVDLHEHGATTMMCVRSPVNVIPRDLLGMSAVTVGILTSFLPASVVDAQSALLVKKKYKNLEQFGLKKAPYGPRTQTEKYGQVPLIDVGTIDLIRAGKIKVYPGIEKFAGKSVHFDDGQKTELDAVVAAIGYHPGTEILDSADFLSDGKKPQVSGEKPGLFFCGFRNPSTGNLRGIGIEARQIAKLIAKQS